MNARILMILSAVLMLFVYVGWRLAESFGATLSAALMALLFIGFFFYRPIHKLKNRKLRQGLITAIHLEMGFLSFLLVTIFARDLISIPLRFFAPELTQTAYSVSGTVIVLTVAVLALLAGVYIASVGPWVVRVSVPIKGLAPELEGFTIAQLSDVHIGPFTKPERIEAIVAKTLALEPRVITLTGDIGDGPVAESREAIEKLSALSRVPSFYVTGNHEYYWNGPEWIHAFTQVGLQPLLNRFAVIRQGTASVAFIGTPDPTARMINDGPDLKRAMSTTSIGESLPSDAIKILLAHQPGISNEAREAGIDLQLSGHTHAGQFFPWTLVVKRVHEFSRGLGRTGKTWVYVNPGTGSWGPQIRLGTKTEITLLTLTKDS